MSHTTNKPLPMKIKPIPTYFSQTEKKDGRAQQGKAEGKMADLGGEARGEATALTKADLLVLTNKIEGMELELLKKNHRSHTAPV